MDAPVKAQGRNQSVDCCKLIAAIFVVFIHVPLPGNLGIVLSCLGRFAVPIFFAISGYYSYRIGEKTLKKRILHVIWLNFIASLVCLLWDCFHAWMQEGRYIWSYLRERLLLSSEQLADWVVLQINPYGGHLWYLTAILLCYIALWLYQRFFGDEEVNYTPLYIFSAGMLLFHIAMGEMAIGLGARISNKLVRNFWFYGLPMFSMGIFLRQYQSRILTNYRLNGWKLAALVVLGGLLSVLQRFGMGSGDLPVGMLLTAPALMLLIASYPTITKRPVLANILSLFGDTATSVYIVHLVFLSAYEWYLAQYFDWLIPDRGIMITLFTVTASVVSCLALQILVRIVRTLKK